MKPEKDLINCCSDIAEELNTSYFSYKLIWSIDFHNSDFRKITNCKHAMLGDSKRYLDSQKIVTPQKNIVLESSGTNKNDISARILIHSSNTYNSLGTFEFDLSTSLNINNPKRHLKKYLLVLFI